MIHVFWSMLGLYVYLKIAHTYLKHVHGKIHMLNVSSYS